MSRSIHQRSSSSRKDDVIDLTLDSDDEVEQPLAHSSSRNVNGKRKERTPPFMGGPKRPRIGNPDTLWGDDDEDYSFLTSTIPPPVTRPNNFSSYRGGSSTTSSSVTSSGTGPQHPSTFRMHPYPPGSTSPPVPMTVRMDRPSHGTVRLPPIRLPAPPGRTSPTHGFMSPPSNLSTWGSQPPSPDSRRYDYRSFS